MRKSKLQFEEILSNGCGIDVHKETVVVTVSGKGIDQQTRTFSTFTNSLIEMGKWLKKIGIENGAMESTGIYWKPVINILNPSALVFKPVSIALIALSCPTMFIKGCTSLVDVKANFLQLHVFFKSSGFNSSI